MCTHTHTNAYSQNWHHYPSAPQEQSSWLSVGLSEYSGHGGDATSPHDPCKQCWAHDSCKQCWAQNRKPSHTDEIPAFWTFHTGSLREQWQLFMRHETHKQASVKMILGTHKLLSHTREAEGNKDQEITTKKGKIINKNNYETDNKQPSMPMLF